MDYISFNFLFHILFYELLLFISYSWTRYQWFKATTVCRHIRWALASTPVSSVRFTEAVVSHWRSSRWHRATAHSVTESRHCRRVRCSSKHPRRLTRQGRPRRTPATRTRRACPRGAVNRFSITSSARVRPDRRTIRHPRRRGSRHPRPREAKDSPRETRKIPDISRPRELISAHSADMNILWWIIWLSFTRPTIHILYFTVYYTSNRPQKKRKEKRKKSHSRF